ncbi:hypothetical protein Tco_1548092 [Tanacetum coccineum]
MVRSMMNLTTMLLSFWDYALESATHILNMVLTKKVVILLVDNDFIQCFTDYEISVSKNNVLYFNAIPSNGIYEIDMLNLVPNVKSIYNVNNKRAKHNLDSIYLWHCRLAHIRYPKKTMGYYFYFPPEKKIVVAKYVEFSEKNLISQKVSRRAIELEEIQDEDTSPSETLAKFIRRLKVLNHLKRKLFPFVVKLGFLDPANYNNGHRNTNSIDQQEDLKQSHKKVQFQALVTTAANSDRSVTEKVSLNSMGGRSN